MIYFKNKNNYILDSSNQKKKKWIPVIILWVEVLEQFF